MNQMNDYNPNQAECYISDVAKLWAELKLLMENPNPKEWGIIQVLLRGRPLRHEQYALFQTLVRDIGYDLSGLTRAESMTDEGRAENTKMLEEGKARKEAYVSPFQEWANEKMADYVKDNALSEKLLEGDVQCVRFTYSEVEKNYRSDSNEVQLPIALIEHYAENGTDGSLPDWLVNQISDSGGEYELFDNMETDDSETMSSEIEHDA